MKYTQMKTVLSLLVSQNILSYLSSTKSLRQANLNIDG